MNNGKKSHNINSNSVKEFDNCNPEHKNFLLRNEGNGIALNKFEVVKEDNSILPNSVRLQSLSSIISDNEGFWDDFKKYLINEGQRRHSVRNKIGYARRFYFVLESKNANDLMRLSHGSKVHAMKALASLSKYLGEYDQWLDIVKKYQIKWSKPNKSLHAFNSIVNFHNQENNWETMLKWIKEVVNSLPQEYSNIIKFTTLTGLRPDEAQKAIWLIKSTNVEYVDRDASILKHYSFPHIFLRQTKNAYLSVINEQIIDYAKYTPIAEHYYNSLRKKISKNNGFKMNMYYCRKVFATFLRDKGMEPEIIDLLQGRISNSIFVNHYYRPNFTNIISTRIKPLLLELSAEIG